MRSDGIANLSGIPDLSQKATDEIQMTLSKAYMMHMLTKKDWKNITAFKNYLFEWNKFDDKFDTYARWRLWEIFDELEKELIKNFNIIKTPERILHCMNENDLRWLNDHEQNLSTIENQSLAENIADLKGGLTKILNRCDYLSYFPLYRDRPLLQHQHRAVLDVVENGGMEVENYMDLLTELSQLRVSLNSLGNGRERSILGFTQGINNLSPAGTVKWLDLQEKVCEIKRKIDLLQLQTLYCLEDEEAITVNWVISQLKEEKGEKRKKIEIDQQKNKIWILSLDGGGVRGKIAAEILRDLSHRLKEKGKRGGLSDTFDFVTGTSVGGLIALALNLPGENGQPAVDEDYIATLLEQEKASIIFPEVHWLTKLLAQINSNAYEADPMENLLLANFGYTPLSEVRMPTMVMAHSNGSQEPVGFRSFDSSTQEMTVTGSASSTTAAPTYLSPVTQCYDGKLEEFVDGGMTVNNPVYHGLYEFLQMRDFNKDKSVTRINILSIGTGNETHSHPHGAYKAGGTGALDNLKEGTMQQGLRDAHEKTVLTLGGLMQGGVEISYYRLNPDLDKPIELDSAREENIAKLRTLVYESILQNPVYELLVRHLAGDENITRNQYIKIGGKDSNQPEMFLSHFPYLESIKTNRK